MKAPLYAGDAIKLFLPQREPILMVDTLYSADANQATTGITVSADCMFVEDGQFTEAGLIEHQAQSASAMVGYQAFIDHRPTPVGYIGEVKRCTINRLPKIGEELTTTISVTSVVGAITVIKASTLAHDDIVAECTMKIYVKPTSK